MHSHPNSLTVFLTDGTLRMTMPHGTKTEGTSSSRYDGLAEAPHMIC